MSNNTTVLTNLLRHIERSDFEKAVRDHNGDKKTRRLSTFNMFKVLVYGQITSAYSLREIESSLAVNSSKLYHSGFKETKRSTLCDALEKRPHEIFEKVFYGLVEKARFLTANSNRRFKNPLKIIDASTIDLCLSRYDWAKFRTTKGAVKLHVKIDGDNLYPEQTILTTGSVHEVNEMSNLCSNSGEIYVMDRGYVDFKRLYDIELSDSFFVTRMKSNCQHTICKKLSTSKNDPVRLDALVYLTGTKALESYPKEFRKIVYHDDEYDKNYIFITNNLKLSALEIAEIYKARWQIEIFFKWIKQNLKIKTFWGTSRNAVFIQIWVALIVALLLWIHKSVSKIQASAQRILQMLKTTILTKNSVAGIFCRNCHPEPPIINRQLFFDGWRI